METNCNILGSRRGSYMWKAVASWVNCGARGAAPIVNNSLYKTLNKVYGSRAVIVPMKKQTLTALLSSICY